MKLKWRRWRDEELLPSLNLRFGILPDRRDLRVFPSNESLRNIFKSELRKNVTYTLDQEGIQILCEKISRDHYRGKGAPTVRSVEEVATSARTTVVFITYKESEYLVSRVGGDLTGNIEEKSSLMVEMERLPKKSNEDEELCSYLEEDAEGVPIFPPD